MSNRSTVLVQINGLKFSKVVAPMIGLVLVSYACRDPFIHTWDEQFHALVAKNLAANPLKPMLISDPVVAFDYTNWTMNHVWLHKQPMALWLMAVSIKIFGNTIWAIRIPSIFYYLISGLLVRKIGEYFIYDSRWALLAQFLFYVNGFMIEIHSGRTSTDHIDACYLMMFLMAFYCLIAHIEKKNKSAIFLFGIFLGLSWLTKTFSTAILLPIYLILSNEIFYKKLAYSFLALGIAITIFLPWQFFISMEYPLEALYESQLNFLHFTNVIEGHNGSIWWHIEQMHRIWHELIYGILIWLAYYYFNHQWNKKYTVLWLWIIIPYLVFSMAATKMRAYVLICGPAMFIAIGLFTQYVFNRMWKIWIKIIVLLIICIPAIAYGLDRAIKKPNDGPKKIKNTQLVYNLKSSLSATKHNTIFGLEEYAFAMYFYDNVTAYPIIPVQSVIDSLKNADHHIIVVDTIQPQKNY